MLLQPAGPLISGAYWLAGADYRAVAAAAETSQLVLSSETMITAGAKRKHYIWTGERSKKPVRANVHVIEIDLSNPYVNLNTMSGAGSTVANVTSTLAMAQNTGAVAGVNADYFNMSAEGVPMGAQITSGTLITSPSQLAGMYAFGVTQDRKPVIDLFTFQGQVTAENGTSFPLSGINQAAYYMEGIGATESNLSHLDRLYIYTSAWVAGERPQGSFTLPTEALIVDGIVTAITEKNKPLPESPPANGFILRGHGKAADYILSLQVGQQVAADYTLTDSSGAQVKPESYQMMVGGHTILVNGGKAAAYSRDPANISGSSARARTGVGYSQDGKTVYLVTVEYSNASTGMTVKEFQQALVSLGVWKAVNLDGGGSTTMVDRPLGSFGLGLSHQTQEGTYQRRVVNGIGIYTTAPKGELGGVRVSGKKTLFLGEQAAYELKAYDMYYNPLDPAEVSVAWTQSALMGMFEGNVFTPDKTGKLSIVARKGDVRGSLDVEVVGKDQINKLAVSPSSAELRAGAAIKLPVTATLADGQSLRVPAKSIQWQFVGFEGEVSDDGETITIQSVEPGATLGHAIANYDGYTAMATLGNGTVDVLWENFEKMSYAITSAATAGVLATPTMVTGLPGQEQSTALQLAYNFTNGSGTKAAYAVLNGASGASVAGEPRSMSVDLYGDGSGNWVRAEFADATGKSHLVTVAQQVDWTGWRNVKADLSGLNMAFPVKLKRLYVASLEQGQEQRALEGKLAFDNIRFQVASSTAPVNNVKLVMTLNKPEVTVNGAKDKLDVAPFAINGYSYVPMKFIVDAIGGQVEWNDKERRVTIIRGNQLLEMWVGNKNYLLSGARGTSEQAPIIRSGRTFVPLRFVTETLGLKVEWDDKARTITIF